VAVGKSGRASLVEISAGCFFTEVERVGFQAQPSRRGRPICIAEDFRDSCPVAHYAVKPQGQVKAEAVIADRFDDISLLADVPTELLADPDESAVDVAGSLSHAGCGR
jgi:hypothetical protein